MYRFGAVMALVLAMAGCEAGLVSEAKGAVTKGTLDPSAVQFEDVRVGPDKAVCGKFNTKNGYGAYIGFKLFVYDAAGKLQIEPERPPLPSAPSAAAIWNMSLAERMEKETELRRAVSASDGYAATIAHMRNTCADSA